LELTEEEIRAAVKAIYARKAEESDQWYPYCFASQSAFGAVERARLMGYSEAELKGVPEESIMALGCGNPFSLIELRPGDTVLDLGSGGGMDAFLAAARVGPRGKVIGVDITGEMVRKAQTTAAHFGYRNVEFRMAEMESLPIESGSVDAVISNCSISLSTDKPKVLREAFRALKPDGILAMCEIARQESAPAQEGIGECALCAAGVLEKSEYADGLAEAGFEQVEIAWEREFEFEECRDSVRALSIGVRARKPVSCRRDS